VAVYRVRILTASGRSSTLVLTPLCRKVFLKNTNENISKKQVFLFGDLKKGDRRIRGER
jgi:hypothetical protein